MLSLINKLYTKFFGGYQHLHLPPGETELDYVPLEEYKIKKKTTDFKIQKTEIKSYTRRYEVSKDRN